ncbi:MAG: 16S rRNA (cytosine(967)-C(5))-methyltransferase RsmB [Firmicutes bacterium]|nr:16S rRNA (cytosine(967)-C(5))-methyltransferase RsmB [Bacillota bacterium]MCL1953810.1 16S rRNA (cytosine(967)-C(5))-methyltransferase RsmB [Bacillota bacterium]
MNISNLKIVHSILSSVYRDRAYSNIALNKALNSNTNCDVAAITHMVYGVLKFDLQLDYFLCQLTSKPPKPNISTLLKMGIFAIKYTKTPQYATINNCVELSKILFKGGVNSFVNAILRKVDTVKLPTLDDTPNSLSINYSCPKWIVELLIKEIGIDTAKQFLNYQPKYDTHIRCNYQKLNSNEFEKILAKTGEVCKSELGYYVNANQLHSLDKDIFVIQSLSSMLVVHALGSDNISKVLDLCAAPGGKSVYFLQNNPKSNILACDIHKHKIDIILNYAKNMGVGERLNALKNDATVFNPKFENSFDIVMCDVPCSGLGLVHSKHEIKFNISPQDLQNLSKIQSQILENASRYVKLGGKILYSTCTITKIENESVIKNFLQNNNCFEIVNIDNQYIKSDIDGCIRLLPHINNTDGFFATVLKKIDSNY